MANVSGNHFLNEEYEAQFYGFLPSSLVEGLIRLIEERIDVAIDQVDEHIKRIPDEVLSADNKRKGTARYRAVIMTKTTKILSKLHFHLINEVLKIPKHLLLTTDAHHVKPATSLESKSLQDEIDELLLARDRERYMQSLLKEELVTGKTVLEKQEDALKKYFSPDNLSVIEDMERFIEQEMSRSNSEKQEFEGLETQMEKFAVDNGFTK